METTLTSMTSVRFGDCFGWVHHYSGSDRGAILCAATGYEALGTHQSWRVLADRLAAAGLPTLRFDYPGYGDSLEITKGTDAIEASIEFNSASRAVPTPAHRGPRNRADWPATWRGPGDRGRPPRNGRRAFGAGHPGYSRKKLFARTKGDGEGDRRSWGSRSGGVAQPRLHRDRGFHARSMRDRCNRAHRSAVDRATARSARACCRRTRRENL